MTNNHLTDNEIQEFVFQKDTCNKKILEHIMQCESCKQKAGQYSFIFDVIREEEKPAFDFNLSELVIAQLPLQQKKKDNIPFYLSFGTGTILAVMIAINFGNTLLALFWSLAPILTALIFITLISLSIFLCIDMYKKHNAKMKALNLYETIAT